MKNNNSSLKSKLNVLLLVVVTIIVLYISLKDNFFEVVEGTKQLNIFWVIIAIIIAFGYYFFRSLSLYAFVKNFKEIDFKKILKLVFITQFFDGITPSSSGGQPYQIYALNKDGIAVVDATNIAIQNFIVYQIALVLLGFIAVITNCFCHFFDGVGAIKKLIILGFIINILVIIGLFSLAFMKKFNKFVVGLIIRLLSKFKIIKDKEKAISDFNENINKFHDGALVLFKNKKMLISTILYNFLGLILIYSIPGIILFGLGDYTSINVFESIVSSAYVMLIGSFVPIPGGSGGLEYAFARFYGVFITGPKLTLVMLLWRSITYYLGVIAGAVLLNIRKKR